MVILDISMPHVDGLEVCRRLREGGDRTPVLMLTAREEVDDRVAGLDAGADDYLVKPFALRELLARVRALLRRAGEDDEQEDSWRSRTCGWTVSPTRRGAASGCSSSRAPSSCCWRCSCATPARCSPARRSSSTSGDTTSAATSNSLGVYMGYLRRKTEVGEEPRLLHTVRGVGYVLRGQ